MNADARKVGETWDPAKDEAAGQQADEAGGVSVLRDASRGDGIDGQDGAGDPDGTDFVRIITSHRHPHLLWVAEHLQNLSAHAQVISGPASHVAEQRRQPWWR